MFYFIDIFPFLTYQLTINNIDEINKYIFLSKFTPHLIYQSQGVYMDILWSETTEAFKVQIEGDFLAENSIPEYDVAVCGGGPAGVAAATVAARQGLKTILIEKNGFCGGAAVAGLSGTICGLYLTQEDIAKKEAVQVVFGFAKEFQQALEKNNGLTPPQIYGNTHVQTFDPTIWKEVADDFLTEANVTCLFHTLISDVFTDESGKNLVALQVESSKGHAIIRAKNFIDATGDAVLVSRLGLEYTRGQDGAVQNPTTIFRLSHVDANKFYAYFGQDTICPADLTQKLTEAFTKGTYNTPRNRIWVFPTPLDSVFLMNCTQLAGQNGEILDVLYPEQKTFAEIQGRRAAREYYRFFKDNVPGFDKAQFIEVSPEVGVRQTRSIVGEKRLMNDDVANCRKCDDAIARSSWPIELHAGEVSKLHWLQNDYYEVPYLTLVPKNIDNLVVAGRCLSTEHEALASARVTAQCFEYGHAAAVSTALSLKNKQAYRDVDVVAIQEIMRQNGSQL